MKKRRKVLVALAMAVTMLTPTGISAAEYGQVSGLQNAQEEVQDADGITNDSNELPIVDEKDQNKENPDEPKDNEEKEPIHTGWYQAESGEWYLYDEAGNLKTGWCLQGNTWYYLDGENPEHPGMMTADQIKEINGKNIHIYREVSVYTLFHSNENLEVTYERDGEEYTCTISPKYNEEAGRNLFGIYGNTMRERGNIFETIKYSVYEVKYWIEVTMDSLKMLVTGRVSVNELSGPVGIVKNIGDTYDESKSEGTLSVVLTLINYSIMLTANLGIMNLLPLPALDGGRLVFLIIEAIRGKRVSSDKEGMVHFAGFALLMVLMVVVMFNDIMKLV